MTEHPEQHLSAYLDQALGPAERASVAAHLDGCARCRAQLAELHATSSLIGSLTPLVPRRSLVPRLDRAPAWLRPVRLLGAMGSGLFVFLFIASAVISSGSSLGGGTTTAERLAEKGQFGAAVNALASDSGRTVGGGTAQPAVPAAAAQPTQSAIARNDAIASAAATAAFAPAQDTGAITSHSGAEPQPQFGPPPAVFLAGAALFAIAAFLAHRRLRRT